MDYLQAWGVEPEAAHTLADTLDTRVDGSKTQAAERAAAILEALDAWTGSLPELLGLPEEADRVALVVAVYGARLLSAHPGCLDDPAALLDAVRDHLGAWTHGTSPKLDRQEMHRQPLGELPRVLRGEFWSGTCLLYTSPSPRDQRGSRMPSSA